MASLYAAVIRKVKCAAPVQLVLAAQLPSARKVIVALKLIQAPKLVKLQWRAPQDIPPLASSHFEACIAEDATNGSIGNPLETHYHGTRGDALQPSCCSGFGVAFK
jgi:predicted N-acyltransferase